MALFFIIWFQKLTAAQNLRKFAFPWGTKVIALVHEHYDNSLSGLGSKTLPFD